jgi:tetratricopeptide (TPR) repeat protein
MHAVGPFTLRAPLGAGGNGVVFAARHEPTGEPVAVKVLRDLAPRALEAFRREVEAAASMAHPAVVQVLEHGVLGDRPPAGLAAGAPWLAMERASLGSLDQQAPPASWEAAREVVVTVLGALSHAHARGVVHRDLKPANVLVCGPSDRRPGLKLADFGLAWAIGGPEGVRAGTPAYMAPEACAGRWRELGPWTDLYAIGCMTWELVCGAPPFSAPTTAELLNAQQREDPPPMRPRVAVPAGLEAWMRSMLEKAPAARPTSAALAARLLQELDGDGRIDAVATTRATTSSSTWSFTRALDPGEGDPVPAEAAPARFLAPPPRWSDAGDVIPPPLLLGAGLGLFAARAAPLVHRYAERDALWAAFHRVATTGELEVVTLWGRSGDGRTRLLAWLAEQVLETGAGRVVPLDAPEAWETALQLAEEGPVLLVADDPDPESPRGALVRQLTRAAVGAPILVVATATAAGTASAVHVAPMSASELAALAAAAAGLAPSLALELAERADGSPRVVLAAIGRWVAEDRLVASEEGFVLRGDPAWHQLADAWRGPLEHVLGALSEDEATGLTLAALLGATVASEEWERACRADGVAPPWSALQALVGRGLATRDASDRWSFAQAPIRWFLVERARGGRDFARLAGIAADALLDDPERRGLLLAEAGRAEEAVKGLLDAVTLAAGAGDEARVRRLHERLVRLLEEGRIGSDDRRWAAVMRAEAWLLGLRPDAAALQRLSELVATFRARAAERPWGTPLPGMLAIAATVAGRCGRADEGLRYIDEALALQRSAYLLRRRAVLLEGLGRMADAREVLALALALAEQSTEPGARRHLGTCLNDVADFERLDGDLASAEARLRRSLEVDPDGPDAPVARVNLASIWLAQGRLEEAHHLAAEALHDAERRLLGYACGAAAGLVCRTSAGLGHWATLDAALNRLRRVAAHVAFRGGEVRQWVRESGDLAAAAGHPALAERISAVDRQIWG